MLQAQLHMVQDNAYGALAAIKSRPEDAPQLARFFGLRIRANVMIDQYDNAVEAAVEWADMAPTPRRRSKSSQNYWPHKTTHAQKNGLHARWMCLAATRA